MSLRSSEPYCLGGPCVKAFPLGVVRDRTASWYCRRTWRQEPRSRGVLEGPRTPSGPERALCGGGVRSCRGRGHGARGNGGSWSAVSRRVVLLACLACVPRSTRAPSSKEHHPENCAVRARGFALALRCHSRTRESRAERYIALTLLALGTSLGSSWNHGDYVRCPRGKRPPWTSTRKTAHIATS